MRKTKNKLPEKNAKLVQNFSPKNNKQQAFMDLIDSKEVILATGIPGSGKTFVALAKSLSLLGNFYKQLILVKSVTTIPGEALGFLPGSELDKMDPFIMSFTWNIDKICGEGSAKELIRKGIIKVLPLAYIRGLSIDNSIVILDETQNLDSHTFKSAITRIGDNSKYIFLGDTEQIDRRKPDESCLRKVMDIFKDSKIVGTIEFTDEDCVRNPIIPEILSDLKKHGI